MQKPQVILMHIVQKLYVVRTKSKRGPIIHLSGENVPIRLIFIITRIDEARN